jgi:hypothetical protein
MLGVNMKTVLAVTFAIVILSVGNSLASDLIESYLCSPYVDPYRNIAYWARATLSVDNYDLDTKDAELLKLKVHKNKNDFLGGPNKNLNDHFKKEFARLVQGKLPVAKEEDTEKVISEYRKATGKDNWDYSEFDAYEQSKRRALYGANPGAIYITISISRSEFPVLYEIKTNVSTDEDLRSYDRGDFVSQKNLGYSSPQYIEAELKRMITLQLTKVANAFKIMRSCNK